jgi:tRNA A-37 threonylcarbamoyl transferase component Bud32
MKNAPDSPPTDPPVQFDALRKRFEQAWQSGPRPRLQDYLAEVAGDQRPGLLRELLPLEVQYRRKLGETPALKEYQHLCPEGAEFLAELLAPHAATTPPVHAAEVATLHGFLGPPVVAGDLGAFAGYRVVRVLGVGGMGLVLEAIDSRLDRRLALKLVRPHLAHEPELRRRFLREARCAAAITHDHILPIYQVGEEQGVPFIAMPLLPGQTLADRLRRQPRPPLALLLQVGRETALALAAAHEAGLIHRDVKPSNLWLEEIGASAEGKVRVKLLDFGLARPINVADSISISNHVLGTPAYMSPEQAEARPVDGRSDLFSLGCVLYRMATARPPFKGDSLTALLLAITTQTPMPPANLPAPLSELILRLLARDPDQRPQSARQVVEELNAIEKSLVLEATTPAATSCPAVASPTRKQRWWTLGAAVAVVAFVALVGIMAAYRWRPADKQEEQPAATGTADESKPLQIAAVEVIHFPYRNGKRAEDGLAMGQPGEGGSFAMRKGDGAELSVRLSRPGYAFVLAFRADGQVERVLPEKADEVPPRVEAFTYPFGKRRGVEYRMEEGIGLHAFAVVASSKPLPAYERWWWAKEKHPWARHPAPAELVWYDDGVELETRTPRSVERGDRAAHRKVSGKADIIVLTDWLRKRPGVEAVTVVGFGVLPEEK